MFLVLKMNWEKVDIVDTEDGVVETYKVPEVFKICRQGVKIRGVDLEKKIITPVNLDTYVESEIRRLNMAG